VLTALAGRLRVPDLGRHLQERRARARYAAGTANRVTCQQACGTIAALARAVAEMVRDDRHAHARPLENDVRRRRSTTTSSADVSRNARQHAVRARRRGCDGAADVDPGVGFAKRPLHSYGVLARLPESAAALDQYGVVGLRANRSCETRSAAPRGRTDWGTAAAVTAAVLAGAHIVRVHAVAEMSQVVRVAEEIRKHGKG
jgi:hypothetical protein